MIDGTQGDNCDYVIAASSSVTTVPTITSNQEICIGQTAHLTATEGTSYLWSSNPTDPSLAGQSTHASISVNPTVNTIYTVAITQEGNNAFCSTSNNTLTSSVTVHSLPLISTINTFEHCHLSDGTGCVLVVGDSNSYHYLWNTTPTQAIQTVENLSEGTYQVTVTGTNWCASIATSSINKICDHQAEIVSVIVSDDLGTYLFIHFSMFLQTRLFRNCFYRFHFKWCAFLNRF